MAETALIEVADNRIALKDKREGRKHERSMALLNTAKTAVESPIGILILASVANQLMYNAGLFNPHDPFHTEREDWAAGENVSNWIFFATLTVAACMAAKQAADVIPSLSDFI